MGAVTATRAIILAIGLSVGSVTMTSLLSPDLQPLANASNLVSAGQPPVCDIGGPYPCQATIRFDGRRSYDPDGVIVSYAWDFGDGQTSTEAYIIHNYQATGTYEVSLMVVDNDNLSSICQTTIEVHEPCGECPPLCDAAGPYYGVIGEPIQLDGSGSISVNTCLIVLYEWNFGDGATGTGSQPSHIYSAPGTFVITLTIWDSDGAASSCTTTASITGPSAVVPYTWGRIKCRWDE
jgi:chitodextrinase